MKSGNLKRGLAAAAAAAKRMNSGSNGGGMEGAARGFDEADVDDMSCEPSPSAEPDADVALKKLELRNLLSNGNGDEDVDEEALARSDDDGECTECCNDCKLSFV